MTLTLGLDLDDCAADFVGQLSRETTGFDPATITEWGALHTAAGFADYESFEHYLKHSGIFRRLEPVEGFVDFVEWADEQGHSIIFLSSRPDCDIVHFDTGQWLKHFTRRSRFYRVGLDDKTKFKCDVYVDDAPHHLSDFLSRVNPRAKVIRFSRPWNDHLRPPGLISVDDWRSVRSAIEYVPNVSEFSPHIGAGAGEVRVTDPNTGGQKGQKIAQPSAIDPEALLALYRVAGYGGQKYARLNFYKGYDWSLSYDAAQRHIHAFWSGEEIDPESGHPHLAHAAWHCLCLLMFSNRDRGNDDRWVESYLTEVAETA